MPTTENDVKSVFDQALEIESSEDRREWLERACAGDNELQRQVEGLLQAHEDAGSFLQHPLPPTVMHEPVTAEVGTVIGPYKLREQIGEGGMGVVYVAEQTEPVRRKVALKLIKPGLDTKQVIARFEAERQALALMDHPNIARVFDAGTTEAGRPYFVMELVRGKPITEYCDEQRLTTRQRLELFVAVCRAVQHAHQKGVIHRDIKPSNVLVTITDGSPVPKVIDFGLAKAMHHSLSEGTVYTRFAQFVGTPAYMSPEQAEMTSHDIDTRSDVYSLGVLLYELLTGETPFDKDTLNAAGFDEMRRMIREDEPPRPSARLSTLNDEEKSTVSDRRGSDPRNYGRQLRGDLDWIVMKALEKNRSRRYDTASDMAIDVERYLAYEPIDARSPSTWYRLRKFCTRHRTRVTATVAFVVTFIILVGYLTIAMFIRRSNDERQRKHLVRQINESLTEAEHFRIRSTNNPNDDLSSWTKAREAAQKAKTLANHRLIDEYMQTRVQALVQRLSREESDRRFLHALDKARVSAASDVSLSQMYAHRHTATKYARAFIEYGITPLKMDSKDAANVIVRRGNTIRAAAIAGVDHWISTLVLDSNEARLTSRWLNALVDLIDENAWRREFRSAIRGRRIAEVVQLYRTADVTAIDPQFLTMSAVYIFRFTNEKALAIQVLERAYHENPGEFWLCNSLGRFSISIRPRKRHKALQYTAAALSLRPSSPVANSNFAFALLIIGRKADAISTAKKAVSLSPNFLKLRSNLGAVLVACGRQDEAILQLQIALEQDPSSWFTILNLGIAFLEKGKITEAVGMFRRAIALNPKLWEAYNSLGNALVASRQLDEAERCFRTTIKLRPNVANPHLMLAYISFLRQNYHSSVRAFQQASKLWAMSPEMQLTYGNALLAIGKHNDALRVYRRIIEQYPRYGKAYGNVAICLERNEQYAEAVRAHEAALRMSPNDALTYSNFSKLLANCPDESLRNAKKATKLARKALLLRPGNPAFVGNLGAALYRSGEFMAARRALIRRMNAGNQNPSTYLYLAMTEWKLGKYEAAGHWLRKAESVQRKSTNRRIVLMLFKEARTMLGIKGQSARKPVVAKKPLKRRVEKPMQ